MEFKASQKLLDTNKAESTASKDRGDESTDVHKGSDGYINPTDCESNSCEKISISEEEKQRLKNVIKFTRDSVKCFETNVSFHTLKLTTGIWQVFRCFFIYLFIWVFSAEGIKEIEMYLVKNLGGQQSAGLLNIIAEIIHRVLNTIKLPENITKLGQNVVIDAVDTFIELIDEIMDKVRSFDFTPPWIHYCSLENLSIAFPVLMCIFRKQLIFTELQAHSKLFLFKGDLLRYRCNIENLPYGGACKAYWMAFSLLPGQGLVFNLLGVIAASRDINDRLSQIFYFMRAISTTTPFENAKIVLLAILEQISQKMIKTDFGQYHEIFKKPSMTDVTDRSSQIINPLNPNGSSFTWTPSTHDFETRSRNWKERLSRFSHSVIIKMITNSLFHMINLLITKSNSNSTLFTTCERFLALLSQILEREEISSKELLQLTTIFILALKSRDSFDESYQLLSRTFVHYTGLLFSRFYQVMIHRNSAPLSLLEQKGMIILPSLCCIESYWDSFEDKLSPVESCHFTCYNFFDFSIIRKNVKLLGHLLYFYIGNLNVSVKRAESDDVMENVYVLPEIILCCMGSRFPVKTDALQLNAIQEYSETFKTFLIRVLLAQELLAKMVKKEFFGINSFFEYSSGIHDQDTEISRHIYTLFESNDPHRRHPIHAQQNF
uniref:DNA/RNA-binding domain-containing protein n=1 Tax=Panagrolaimus sp. ES5 TaxID=591445 RepID=A0AC34F644_9BILA